MSAVTRAAAPGISAILPAVRTISSRAKRSWMASCSSAARSGRNRRIVSMPVRPGE